MVDSSGSQNRRWTTIFLTGLIILMLGLLSCTLLFIYLVTDKSTEKDDTMVDTLAALQVPTTLASRVTRPTGERSPLPWNTSTTPPEQRGLVPFRHLQGDECIGPLCRYVANMLRSKLSSDVDPCVDFYQYVCGKFQGWGTFTDLQTATRLGDYTSFISLDAPSSNQTAIQKAAALYRSCMSLGSSYQHQMTELKRWMTEMNLNFLYTRRLESVNPVDIMVRGSLDLGVEAIISIYTLDMGFDPDYEKRPIEINYSKEQQQWLKERSLRFSRTNENYYAMLFLKYGVERGQDLVLAKKILAYEERLRQIENSTVNWDESEVIEIYDLGQNTYPYVSVEEWGALFYKYTDGHYVGDDQIRHFIQSTRMLKKLFEDKDVGKTGLQYMVAWSFYRQLAKFTDPDILYGSKKADESCFLLIKNVMRLAILSHYFQIWSPPHMVRDAFRVALSISYAFYKAVQSSSWLPNTVRGFLNSKGRKYQIGSPGNRLNPKFIEKFYEPLPDVPLNRLFHSWIEARRINAHYRWKDQETMWYDEEFVGATYNEATIKIPIAIIQPPFFYEYGPEALNYGSLGMIIGHEIMHGLDISGWGGPLRNLDEMKKEHNKRALCLRRSHRSVLPSSSQRDELVDTADSENLADFVGTMLAYAAFASSAEEDRKVKLAGFDKSPDQLFFISQCNTFCARNQEAPENYAPFRSRCMVPLRNMPEFSRAFGCAAGTVMNPNKKCTYW
ncbi:neprilysin-1-like [Rhipicephalus microplus]|uniref:neprilysin-1-like n=1 Tax=Rhipicephalus microplus TaxID=6941 RepID=UPI003F6C69F8